MQKYLKAVHLIGLAMFLGSILGHAVAGLVENAHESLETRLVIRQLVDVATWYLTVPGLVLLVLTGGWMVVRRRALLLKMRWMVVHLAIGALILLNAVLILVPTGQEILTAAIELAAGELAAGGANLGDLQVAGAREAMFGAINILLCLAALLVAVIKPRLGKMKL